MRGARNILCPADPGIAKARSAAAPNSGEKSDVITRIVDTEICRNRASGSSRLSEPVSIVARVDAVDYLAHLTRESTRFGEAIAAAPAGAPVQSCPGWTADDLLWHLAWVQSWWATIVRDQLTGPDARQLLPERPPARLGPVEAAGEVGHLLAVDERDELDVFCAG